MSHRPCLLVLFALAASSLLEAQDPSFARLRRNLPQNPRGVMVPADWDGDGDTDWFAASGNYGWLQENDPELVLLVNDGHAGFTGAARLDVPFITVAGAAGDLDGDGNLDGLLGTMYQVVYRVEVDGAGGLSVAPTALSLAWWVFDIELLDVEGDGDLDALLGTANGLYLARNHGDGTFDPTPELLARGGSRVEHLAIADFTGDGVPDLAMSSGYIDMLEGHGDGSFSPLFSLTIGYAPTWLAPGDVDGDGDLDLAVQNFVVQLLVNDGAGGFTDASGQVPPHASYSEIALADVDGDADLDWLQDDTVFLNDGQGRFAEGAGGYPEADYSRSSGLFVEDLDADGDVDVVFSGECRVLLGDGAGNFHDTVEEAPFGANALGTELFDVDGDGDLDAFLGGSGWELRRNDGRGVFVEREQLTPYLTAPYLRFGDFDGDGFADFLNGAWPLYFGDGHGHFKMADSGCLPNSPGRVTFASAVGDIDGDGDLDVYHAQGRPGGGYEGGYQAGSDSLWVNDGTGCFTDSSANLPANYHLTYGVAMGDVDGDGDPDILTSVPQLFLNDGKGRFTDATGSLPMRGAKTVALVDLDGDGDLDAYFGSAPGLRDSLFFNDGGGGFGGEILLDGLSNQAHFVDLDGDGDLDLVSDIHYQLYPRGPFVADVEVYVNDGAAVFHSGGRLPTVDPYTAIGDLDLDGDVDIYNGRHVNLNLRRSLAWRAEARLGHPLRLDMTGTPHRSWRLYASTGLDPLDLPRRGRRWIDMDEVFFATHGNLDVDGRATFSALVPDDPVLVGVPIYWQAEIGAPLRWSNYEVTTPVDF